MPGIVLYNRRWALGSDDILLPAVALALVHMIWWDFWIWGRDIFLSYRVFYVWPSPLSEPKRKITSANLTLSWTKSNAGRLQLTFLFNSENGEDQLNKKMSINLFVQARSLDCGARRREARERGRLSGAGQ